MQEDKSYFVTRKSHRKALVGRIASYFAFGFVIFCFGFGLIPIIWRLAFHWEPLGSDLAEWGTFWFTLGGLVSILRLSSEYLEPFLTRSSMALEKGKVPDYSRCYTMNSGDPQDGEVYKQYVNNAHDKQAIKKHFLISDLPIYFVVGPEAPFEIKAEKAGKPFDNETLINEAAKLGLDWLGFKAWFKKEKYQFYYGRLDEQGFRLCEELKPPRNGSAVLKGNTCRWSDFVCTEGAVNLKSKTPPFKMRDLFEGESWTNLEDVSNAGKRYSMLVGICALVTTNDGYLILERRSSHVSSDPGKITSTANGGIQWSDMFPKFSPFHFFRVLGSWLFRSACPHKRSPAWAVLRELKEETGITIRRNCDVNRIFIGAGFDLIHGRDLNLYASLKCHLSIKQVSARRAKAKDRWELDHLIFVDPKYIGPHGTLTGPFKELDLDRQLRAALLCYKTIVGRQNHPSSSAS